ncbi:MAG: hypothetical protein Q8R76_01580 [Candidatus Omnitrophota bacterium]|nr:hypothetical protein [Candidatus Omnitrophota bacterium]
MKLLRHTINIAIRVIAIACVFLSLQKAWANVWFETGNMPKAYRLDPHNAKVVYHYGKTLWGEHEVSGDIQIGRSARNAFRTLTKQKPLFGKGWLFLAKTELSLARLSGDGVSPAEWESLSPYIEKAYRHQPQGAWMAYRTGQVMLQNVEALSESQRNVGVNRIKRAMEVNPEEYLLLGLTYLWNEFHSSLLLHHVTPKTYEGYGVLTNFLIEHHRWDFLSQIHPLFFDYRQREYEAHVKRGLVYLEMNDSRRAWREFQHAYWIDSQGGTARAGMIVSKQSLDQELPWSAAEALVEILETPSDWGPLLSQLEDAVRQTNDPYIHGLYFYRREEFERARDRLLQAASDKKMRRRFLADANWRLGEKRKALALMEAALAEDDPDMRELELLTVWLPKDDERADQKINAVATSLRPPRAWWGKGAENGTLNSHVSQGMVINLRSGKTILYLPLRDRKHASGEFGYAVFRLQGEVIATHYANHENWRTLRMEITTTGGKRWLQAELLNRRGLGAGDDGPEVDLGALRIVPMGDGDDG